MKREYERLEQWRRDWEDAERQEAEYLEEQYLRGRAIVDRDPSDEQQVTNRPERAQQPKR